MAIYVSSTVIVKMDEYVEFLMKTCHYSIDEAETRRWEVEYQVNQHCNPVLMKAGSSGTIKFKSVLQRQEIKRNVSNRNELIRIIKRRNGNRSNTQWNLDYIVSNQGNVYITAIKCYNTFSESANHKSVQHLIDECIDSYIKHLKRDYKCYSNSRIYKSVVNENKSYPSMLNNIKCIRLTESDLVNIVKQCLFESTRHTSLLAESAQDKRVQKFLKSKGYSDYNKRMEIIGKTKHDIPNIRLDNDKFLLGCLRMFFDGQLRDEQSIRQLDNALKYIHGGGHTKEFDENLNDMSVTELNEMFRESRKQFGVNDRERSNSRVFSGGTQYTIVPINSFEEAEPYGRYTEWCVTHGKDAFDSYTACGNRFYFCLMKGFERVEEDDTGAPLNEYGLSMIAVNVDMNGDLTRVTTRYNHEHNGENNPGLETTEQLENVLNVPFYQTFKPYTRQELLDMGVVPFDMVQELLDSGKKPKEIFEKVGEFANGYANVKLNGKWNYINGEGKILSPTWFDDCYCFLNGYAKVELNDKWNYINGEGKIISPTWFDYCVDFENGYAKVELNGKWNFINGEGKILSPTWFDYCWDFENGYAKVELNDKWNFINGEGRLVSPTWFDSCGDFVNGYAKVKLNGKWNHINGEGRLVSPIWSEF